MEAAILLIEKVKWQNKYDNGFHVRMLYNAANIFIEEHRFLAYVSIWEYLFYCDHRKKPFKYFNNIYLNEKIQYLINNYFLKDQSNFSWKRIRIFSDIRNQISHNGKFPISNPDSPFKDLGNDGCGHYMRLFERLTQLLVLKTLGIQAIGKLDIFNVKDHFNELLQKGYIQVYKDWYRNS